MSQPIELSDLLEGTAAQPNEVCLTLYFEHNSSFSASERIRNYMPEVGPWQDTEDMPGTYQATLIPRPFDSIYLITFSPKLSENTETVQ
jgi:hypothetical protein